MKPTRPGPLLIVALVGAVALFGVETLLLRLGEPLLTPPVTLGVTLLMLGVIIPALAWPIRQSTRDQSERQAANNRLVNPFYATRVVVLAKAGALTGAILAGAGVGVVVFLLGRIVVVWGHVVLAGVTVLGGVVLLVGSLLAERWCQIPPSNDDTAHEGEPA